jgi:O-6-methylguanine DNA methyltransferase
MGGGPFEDPFFKQIYAAARRVGWGHTTTYGALAKELGAAPEAARDVGQAMARNPVALIIPCHRDAQSAATVTSARGKRPLPPDGRQWPGAGAPGPV